MEDILGVLTGMVAVVLIFGGGFVTLYFLIKARHAERLALIEKGMSASIFERKSSAFPALKLALLFGGIGIGLLVGSIIDKYTVLDATVGYFSMVFIFGGGGLLIYHFIERKMGKKTDTE